MPSTYSIYTDGGSRGNPGLAAAAFLLYDDNHHLLQKGGAFLGQKTNNEAEYEAFILALDALRPLSPASHTQVTFYSDSQLVVNQLKGTYKIKEPRLAVLAARIHSQLKSLSLSPLFCAIPREQNREADAWVNHILDHMHPVS